MKTKEQEQKDRTALLFRTATERKITSLLIFEGEHLLGIKHLISKLAEVLDPRHYNVLRTDGRHKFKKNVPFLLEYWKNLPPAGNLLIYEHGYCRKLLQAGLSGGVSKKTVRMVTEHIADFEKILSDDKIVFIKIHMARPREKMIKDYEKKIKKSGMKDVLRKRYKLILDNYDRSQKLFQGIRAATDLPHSTWFDIQADSHADQESVMLDQIIEKLEKALQIDSMTAVRSFDAAMDRVREIRRGGNVGA